MTAEIVLLMLLVVWSAVNLLTTLWTYRRLLEWLDAIGEMVGESLDRQERKES